MKRSLRKFFALAGLLLAISVSSYAQGGGLGLSSGPDHHHDQRSRIKDAKFQGGDIKKFEAWVDKNAGYPEEAARRRITGRVVVSFVIEKDGRLVNPKVVKSPSEILSREAMRVVKASPKWIPASRDGRDISAEYSITVDFAPRPEPRPEPRR